MRRNLIWIGLITLLFPGCAVVERIEENIAAAVSAEPVPEAQSAAAGPQRPAARFTQPKGGELGAYKQRVAQQIAAKSDKSFSGELPPILKSVVILDVTLDKKGQPTRVVVSRSNGFKVLERTAVESVQRAGNLPAPETALLSGGQVRYLETWLFRDDGKFQIRSLVQEPQPGAEKMAMAGSR